MFNSSEDKFFEAVLEDAFGKSIKVKSTAFKSGGCINNALKLITTEGDYFLKWQSGIPEDMFQKEAEGLRLLLMSGAIKIPKVIAYGKLEGKHYLLMENIESVSPTNDYWENFGISLADMHRNNSAEKYGLDHDNYIGKLHQPNDVNEDWIDFFSRNRLEYQLRLAIENRMVSNSFIDRYRKFYELLPDLLPVDQPALLHGDMWSGNVLVGNDGKVCLIDPAVYYGHREIELAFTQMFGGFDYDFYTAYTATYPLEPGFEERVSIYNIYPHMVHVNLFGQSYLNGVESVLKRYV
ncbi:MAG: fructosamine kinase family protein [Cyclobacteriaceae bacterium]|nr:fructosamine kinase family protein [Cyclobacteriaceae bacterium]